MIQTLEWLTDTAGCGGLIAVMVFTAATVIYVASLRLVKNASRTEGEEDEAA